MPFSSEPSQVTNELWTVAEQVRSPVLLRGVNPTVVVRAQRDFRCDNHLQREIDALALTVIARSTQYRMVEQIGVGYVAA